MSPPPRMCAAPTLNRESSFANMDVIPQQCIHRHARRLMTTRATRASYWLWSHLALNDAARALIPIYVAAPVQGCT